MNEFARWMENRDAGHGRAPLKYAHGSLRRPVRQRLTRLKHQLEVLESRVLLWAVPIGTEPIAMFYDGTRHLLDFVDGGGNVGRYDVTNQHFLSAIQVGGSLGDGDITPDGHYLYLTDRAAKLIHKVDLMTGASTAISYGAGSPGETAAWDLVITSNTQAYMDSSFSGGGSVLVRPVDLTTDTVGDHLTNGFIAVNQGTNIFRSADRSTVYFASGGGVNSFLYDAATGTLGASKSPLQNPLVGGPTAALSRDGSMLAVRGGIMDDTFQAIGGSLIPGALIFSPTRDRVYIMFDGSPRVDVYDTTAQTFGTSIDIGLAYKANPYGDTMMMSDDGNILFVSTSFGVEAMDVNEGPFSAPVLSLAATSSTFGQNVTLTAQFPENQYTIFDRVTFYDDHYPMGVASVGVTGMASFSLHWPDVGMHTLTAAFTVSSGLTGPGSLPGVIAIGPATPTVNVTVAQVGTLSHPPSFNISVGRVAMTTVTGMVELYDGATLLGSGTLTNGMLAVTPANALAMGVHSITAHYGGDFHYAATDSAALPLDIEPLATTTTLTSPRTNDAPGAHVTLNAHVSGVTAVTAGSVLFYSGATLLGNATVSSSGNASFVTDAMTAGGYQFTATYSGSTDFALSTSAALAVGIHPVATVTTVTVGSSNSTMGVAQEFTATVTADASLKADGLVTFYDGTKAVGSATLDSTGAARLSIVFDSAGTHKISAKYAGSSAFGASTSAQITPSVAGAYTIDLLALYTPAEAFYAGPHLLQNLEDRIADVNLAMANSQIPVTIRLVAMSEVDYSESGDMELDWLRLRTPKDGYMDNVASLRTSVGADLVVLLDSQGTYTVDSFIEGVGSELLNRESSTRDQSAFIVIDAAAPRSDYVLAHEIGHTLGATHAVGDDQAAGISADSHGYRFTGDDGTLYHDIMAYEPGQAIPYYSNPDLYYQGTRLGSTSSANVARVIRATASTVAAYRKSVPIGAITAGDASVISGWAMDPKDLFNPVDVRIELDGTTLTTLNAGDQRGELQDVYGSREHGYSVQLPKLTSGKHTVRVFAVDSVTGAEVLVGTRTVTANHLEFTKQPGTTIAGHTLAPSLTVAVKDASGDVVTGYGGNITVSLASAGTLSGMLTVPVINGVATFADLSMTVAGTYAINAGDGLLSVKSKSFSVSPDAATSHMVLTQSPGNTVVGNTLLPLLTVKVLDQFGNVVKSDHSKITLGIASGPVEGLLKGAATVTASSGVAVFSGRSLTVAGDYVLTLSASGAAAGTLIQFGETIVKATTVIANPSVAKAGYVSSKTIKLSSTLKDDAPATVAFTGVALLVDSDGNTLGTGVVAAGGGVKFTLNNLGPGTFLCHVSYSGDSNHTGATGSTFTLLTHL